MDNTEQIEKYLLEKMTIQEKANFEIRLNNEPALKAEKEELNKLIIGIESYDLKAKLSGKKIGVQINNKNEPKETNRSANIFSLQKLSIAAGFIILIAGALFIFNRSQGQANQNYASAFNVDPGLPTPMSETKNYNFYDAMVDYKMEKYESAIKKWKSENGQIGADTLNYYLGMAYLYDGNLKEASTSLQSVPKSSSFSDLAQWYQVKILIDSGKLKQAQLLLNSLPNNVNPNYSTLHQILKNQK